MLSRSDGATVEPRSLVAGSGDATLISSLPMDVFVIPIASDRYELVLRACVG